MECIELFRRGVYKDTPDEVKSNAFRSTIKSAHSTSVTQLAAVENINEATIYKWIKTYKEHGYNGLMQKNRGRQRKNKPMKTDDLATNPAPLNESEREELVRLRAEVELYKTKLAVTKKVLALIKEKENPYSGRKGMNS